MTVNRWKGMPGLPYEVVDAKHYDALAARLAGEARLVDKYAARLAKAERLLREALDCLTGRVQTPRLVRDIVLRGETFVSAVTDTSDDLSGI